MQKQRCVLLRYVCLVWSCIVITVGSCIQATRLDPDNQSYKENLITIEQQLQTQPQVYINFHGLLKSGYGDI